MFDTMPIALAVLYRDMTSYTAVLRICVVGGVDPHLTVILIHEGPDVTPFEVYVHELDDNDLHLAVVDKQSLTVVARRDGAIVASGVYEVCTGMNESCYVLIPRGGFNILLTQGEDKGTTAPLAEAITDGHIEQVKVKAVTV